ncbi:hypothetical protein ccbrp13_56930 [Ktedonobacteria bacterium brp13]|nr:hypothetical protein ccbrp13_56930 [Ktedonobacteria bacterium brp13]
MVSIAMMQKNYQQGEGSMPGAGKYVRRLVPTIIETTSRSFSDSSSSHYDLLKETRKRGRSRQLDNQAESSSASTEVPTSSTDYMRRLIYDNRPNRDIGGAAYDQSQSYTQTPQEYSSSALIKVSFTDLKTSYDQSLQSKQADYYSGPEVQQSPEAYRQELDKAAAKMVEGTKVWLRCNPDVLKQVLQDEKFKTQYETGMSSGYYDIGLRAQSEADYASYSKDLAPQLRPVYGYLSRTETGGVKKQVEVAPSASSDGSPILAGPLDPLAAYGSVRVCFKDSVKERTSVIVGDSLMQTYDTDQATAKPVPFLHPNGDCFPLGSVDPSSIRSLDDVNAKYVEAQIHYGVTSRDISNVLMEEKDSLLEKLLDKNNIRYKYIRAKR